jgi:hypothetical protein
MGMNACECKENPSKVRRLAKVWDPTAEEGRRVTRTRKFKGKKGR